MVTRSLWWNRFAEHINFKAVEKQRRSDGYSDSCEIEDD